MQVHIILKEFFNRVPLPCVQQEFLSRNSTVTLHRLSNPKKEQDVACEPGGLVRSRRKACVVLFFFRHQRRPLGQRIGPLVLPEPGIFEQNRTLSCRVSSRAARRPSDQAALQARRSLLTFFRCRQGKRHNIWCEAPTTLPWGTEVTQKVSLGSGVKLPTPLLATETFLKQAVLLAEDIAAGK